MKRYTVDEKKEALELAANGTARAASEQLGISYATVLNWIKEEKGKLATESQPDIVVQDMQQTEQSNIGNAKRKPAKAIQPPVAHAIASPDEQVRMLEKDIADLKRENERLKSAINALIA